jgi:sortase A
MRKGLRFLLYLILFAGIAIMAFPYVQGAIMDRRAARIAEDFLSRVIVNPYREEDVVITFTEPTEEEREYPELWDAMVAYNESIYAENQSGMVNLQSFEKQSFVLQNYGLEDEVFGVISVPAIELSMPIYLGASRANMAIGAALMTETSLPIGTPNSNAVICGHRGWNGASYFLHIDKIHIGDIVTITNLWEELEYTVVSTKIITPYNLNAIKIQEGKEMITLLSCHPVASGGKQRYLVFCERVK